MLSIGVENWKVVADNRKVGVDNKKALSTEMSLGFQIQAEKQ